MRRQAMIILACFLLGWFCVFLACGRTPQVDSIELPNDSFSFYEGRLVSSFLLSGFVISKDLNGAPDDQGDSLLFTGLAIGVLDCELIDKNGLLAQFDRMQDHYGGYLVRIDPLPDSYRLSGDYISRDGATGALYGLQLARRRCPALAPKIDKILSRWSTAVGDSLFLYPGSLAGIITPSFHTFWKVGYGKGISDAEYEEAMVSMVVTTTAILEQKSACYPVHLQTLQFLTFEVMNQPIQKRNKDEFCTLTKSMGLMLTDWYCGRNADGIKSWLAKPGSINTVYTLQRCSWEGVEGGNKSSPRVDFLTLYRHVSEGSRP